MSKPPAPNHLPQQPRSANPPDRRRASGAAIRDGRYPARSSAPPVSGPSGRGQGHLRRRYAMPLRASLDRDLPPYNPAATRSMPPSDHAIQSAHSPQQPPEQCETASSDRWCLRRSDGFSRVLQKPQDQLRIKRLWVRIPPSAPRNPRSEGSSRSWWTEISASDTYGDTYRDHHCRAVFIRSAASRCCWGMTWL